MSSLLTVHQNTCEERRKVGRLAQSSGHSPLLLSRPGSPEDSVLGDSSGALGQSVLVQLPR